jgi:hypothetical protein
MQVSKPNMQLYIKAIGSNFTKAPDHPIFIPCLVLKYQRAKSISKNFGNKKLPE